MLEERRFINIYPKTLGMLVSSLSLTHTIHITGFLKLRGAVGCTHREKRCLRCQGLPGSLALTSENVQALKLGQMRMISKVLLDVPTTKKVKPLISWLGVQGEVNGARTTKHHSLTPLLPSVCREQRCSRTPWPSISHRPHPALLWKHTLCWVSLTTQPQQDPSPFR